ncbi:MAG: hypothetical protein LBT82_03525 [Oscillospiraceae bacterium]|jgi:hypothetical protein|nr:hypothetical protein [Oscillospiraceae bacterium]
MKDFLKTFVFKIFYKNLNFKAIKLDVKKNKNSNVIFMDFNDENYSTTNNQADCCKIINFPSSCNYRQKS